MNDPKETAEACRAFADRFVEALLLLAREIESGEWGDERADGLEELLKLILGHDDLLCFYLAGYEKGKNATCCGAAQK